MKTTKSKAPAVKAKAKRPTWRDMTDAEIFRRQFTIVKGLSRAESLCPTDRTVWNFVDDSNKRAHDSAVEIINSWAFRAPVVIL